MHIGLDFDNTIVTYDHLFHRCAVDRELIHPRVPKNKKAIRDSIRCIEDGERRWTVLQGYVYGTRMAEAEPAPGVEDFLLTCRERRVRVSIISHKTLWPALGERVNLRAAARRWLRAQGFTDRFGIDPGDIHFVGTLKSKLGLVRSTRCDVFVDDLVEVLGHPRFPAGVERILYMPGEPHDIPPGVLACRSWADISRHILG